MESTKNGDGGNDLRQRILEAARHLLVQEGYQGLSMRRIGEAGGFSATTIYLYFDDKDALFHALIDEGFEHLHEKLEQVTQEHADDPVRCLRALCRGFVDFGLEHPEYYEIMFMLHPERMERYPPEKYRRARRNLDLLVDTLDEGCAGGAFAAEHPRVAASTVWASLHGIVSLLIARRVDVRIDHEAFIETALRQTVAGVLAHGRGRRGEGEKRSSRRTGGKGRKRQEQKAT